MSDTPEEAHRMGKKFPQIDDKHREFIERQRIFFVGTAGAEGRVNISPKGMDSLRVLGSDRVAWLNLTGSGNETAAHLLENGRITLMFCSFEGIPMILRLYGEGRAVHPRDPAWGELIALFPPHPGARQIVDIEVDLVHTSCGYGVPLFEYTGEREQLTQWAERKGPQGIRQYWVEQNQNSLDGKPTGIGV